MSGIKLFMEVLPILAKGYLGVFGVTIVIIIAVKILSAATKKKN